jgi:hypothetical protein
MEVTRPSQASPFLYDAYEVNCKHMIIGVFIDKTKQLEVKTGKDGGELMRYGNNLTLVTTGHGHHVQ